MYGLRTGSVVPTKSGSLRPGWETSKNRPDLFDQPEVLPIIPRPPDFNSKINTMPSSKGQDPEKKKRIIPLTVDNELA